MRKCACAKDPDGQCLPCRQKISDVMREMGSAVREFNEKMEPLSREFNEKAAQLSGELKEKVSILQSEKLCEGCGKRYADFALARMIPMLLEDASRSLAESVFSNILKKFGKVVRKRPLTEKAWTDLRRRRGWTK